MYYKVYGAGDPSTEELCAELKRRGKPFLTCDIRTSDVATGKRTFLITLIERGLKTIPQVFDSDDNYIGDYDGTMRVLSDNQHLDVA